MSTSAYAILAAAVVLGLWLFRRGRRGVAIDDHPVCGKCGFDLTGRPQKSQNCPECGTTLSPSTVTVGNRRKREGLIYAGATIGLLALFPLAIGIGMSALSIEPIKLKPVWWLLRDTTSDNPDELQRDCAEILDRFNHGKISPDDNEKVAALALRLQADLTKPWDFRFGDLIESLHSNGQLSAQDWNAYLAHNEVATLEVRQTVARGDPIPYHLYGELRGATPVSRSSGSESVAAHVPGCTTYHETGGGSFGYVFDLNGLVPLTPDSWQKLQAGPQTLLASAVGMASDSEANPTLFPRITRQGNWTLLKEGEPSVHLYHDDALAALVEKTLSYDVRVDNQQGRPEISVTIRSDSPPVDLAFDAFMKLGSQEFDSDGYWVIVYAKYFRGTGICIFHKASRLIGQRVDIILRPSPAGAARTLHMDKLLDHEFVFKNVLIQSPK